MACAAAALLRRLSAPVGFAALLEQLALRLPVPSGASSGRAAAGWLFRECLEVLCVMLLLKRSLSCCCCQLEELARPAAAGASCWAGWAAAGSALAWLLWLSERCIDGWLALL